MFTKEINKKTVILARVSSREQEETGYSLPAQVKFLEEYCANHHLPVDKEFCISESASSKSARKQFNEMLAYVRKNKIDIIVNEKVDRLTRNQRDAVTIDQWVNEDPSHEVHFVKNNFIISKDSKASEKFVWNIHVSQAQFNIENLSEEVKKGIKEKLSAGWYPSHPVIGYKSAELGKRKIIVPDESKAPIIERLFTEYATGTHSIESLCNLAKELGLKNDKENYLCKNSMHLLLKNPIYNGAFRWKGEIYLGNHTPIISKDLFDAVQRHLKRKTPLRYNLYQRLFKGILKCTDCGRLITWEEHKGHLYGYCKGCSNKKAVKENEVNPHLLELFIHAQIKDLTISSAIREGVIEYLKNSNAFQTNIRDLITSDISKYTKKLSDLYEDKNEGLISSDLYAAKYKEYNDALFDLKLKLKNLPENTNSVDYAKFEQFFDFSQNMNIYYENTTLDEKRKLLQFVFDDLSYSKGKITYKLSKAFTLLYSAVELTNSSEIRNNEELKNYISEPSDLVVMEAKNQPLEAIRTSWLFVGEEVRTTYVTK
jgi:site-specific DNA recombinase